MINIVNNCRKNNASFGTNLIVAQGIVNHLNTHPEELKEIQNFKEYLTTDGKNWNAELTYDTFTPKTVSTEDTEALIREQAKDYDSATNKAISNSIQNMKPEDAAILIEKLSNDPDRYVSREAVEHTCEIKNSQIAINLVEKFIKSNNSDIIEGAIYSLHYLEDTGLRDSEIEKLLNSDNIAVKRRAAHSLYTLSESQRFNSLLEKISNDPDTEVRSCAAWTIADLNDEAYAKSPQLYDSIIEKSFTDPDLNVKKASLHSLGRLTDTQKAVKFINEAINSDFGRWEKGYTAESAGYIKDTELAKVTIDKLLENPDSEIRNGAVSGIRHIENPQIQNYFIDKLINSPDSEIREEIAYSLDNIKDNKKIVSVSEKLLNDTDSKVRETTARHIGYIDDEKIKYILINKYIQNKDFNIKSGIIDSIDTISYSDLDKAQEFAQILVKDEDKYIQKEANKILEKIKYDSQKDHYHLKITDGDKVLGEKNVRDNQNIFDAFFNAYKVIFEKFAQ